MDRRSASIRDGNTCGHVMRRLKSASAQAPHPSALGAATGELEGPATNSAAAENSEDTIVHVQCIAEKEIRELDR